MHVLSMSEGGCVFLVIVSTWICRCWEIGDLFENAAGRAAIVMFSFGVLESQRTCLDFY